MILLSGLTVSVFAPLASFVDLLALRGIHLWKRALLLPWLFLYAFAVSLILANSLAGIFHHGFKWTYLVLMIWYASNFSFGIWIKMFSISIVVFSSFCLYSAWRHIRAQYTEIGMGGRPTVRTIEELAADIRDTTGAAAARRVIKTLSRPKKSD